MTNILTHNNHTLYQTFFGTWDIIKKCGEVIATGLPLDKAKEIADAVL